MPELPEVETTRRGLLPHLKGRIINNVDVRRRDLRWQIPYEFEEMLVEQRITDLRRIGKYIVMEMSNGWSILGHLGMSGTFRIEPKMPEELRKHDHVLLEMESGEVAIFHDPRRFGFLLLCKTATLSEHPRLVKMGPDPFDEGNFTFSYFKKALSKKKGAIKPVLLNQSLVAGLGNIYVCEALFATNIHPSRPANSLKNKEIEQLIVEIRKILDAAIAAGGSTLKDFAGSDGEAGYFQHAFKVYGQANKPCSSCRQPLKVEVMAGRSSFFCENCQK